MLKVGTVKPGVSQQVFFAQPFVGAPGGVPQPGMPAQAAFGSPQLTQAAWLHVGAGSAAATVNVVLIPVGNPNAKPSAVTHGVCMHEPDCPPQSESLLHALNALLVELVWQIFGPATPTSWYVFGIGWPATMGSQITSQTPPGQWLQSSVQSGLQATKAPPADPPGQLTPPRSDPSQASPGSMWPLPQLEGMVVVVVAVVDVVDVVVVVVGQLFDAQASQQLGFVPIVAGGLQFVADRFTLQWGWPRLSRRQQVTYPGRPHVERDAHRTTLALHSRGSRKASASALATPLTQRT